HRTGGGVPRERGVAVRDGARVLRGRGGAPGVVAAGSSRWGGTGHAGGVVKGGAGTGGGEAGRGVGLPTASPPGRGTHPRDTVPDRRAHRLAIDTRRASSGRRHHSRSRNGRANME